jgi:rhodanese-related sulfurtransferase
LTPFTESLQADADWRDSSEHWRLRHSPHTARAAHDRGAIGGAHRAVGRLPSPRSHAMSDFAAQAAPLVASPALVTDPVADPTDAARHFAAQLTFETDCWDVNDALGRGARGFVVLDVRGPAPYAEGHVPGAVNLPHARIVEKNLEAFPADALYVVYCSGPHCNGADRAALRLARLGRRVKKMIGGIEGWKDEAFGLEKTA